MAAKNPHMRDSLLPGKLAGVRYTTEGIQAAKQVLNGELI